MQEAFQSVPPYRCLLAVRLGQLFDIFQLTWIAVQCLSTVWDEFVDVLLLEVDGKDNFLHNLGVHEGWIKLIKALVR